MAYNELPRYGSVHQKMNEKGRCVYTSVHTHTRTHTMDYYSAIKKKLYFAICKNMDRLEVHYVK